MQRIDVRTHCFFVSIAVTRAREERSSGPGRSQTSSTCGSSMRERGQFRGTRSSERLAKISACSFFCNAYAGSNGWQVSKGARKRTGNKPGVERRGAFCRNFRGRPHLAQLAQIFDASKTRKAFAELKRQGIDAAKKLCPQASYYFSKNSDAAASKSPPRAAQILLDV